MIHCLPGPMSRKALAVENVAAVLAPDGVLFGATVLGRSGNHSWLARRVLTLFNRQGGFDNLDDSEAGLREILERVVRACGARDRRLRRDLRRDAPKSPAVNRAGCTALGHPCAAQ